MGNYKKESKNRKNAFRCSKWGARLTAFILVFCMVANVMVTPVLAAETSYATDISEAAENGESTESLEGTVGNTATEGELPEISEESGLSDPEVTEESEKADPGRKEETEQADPEISDEVQTGIPAQEETGVDAAAPVPVKFEAGEKIDGVEIKVSAPEGVFPQGSKLSVEKVRRDDAQEIVEVAEGVSGEEKEPAASFVFDIKVLDKDGTEIQPDTACGNVKVEFVLPNAPSEGAEVIHVSEVESAAEGIAEEETAENGSEVITDGTVEDDSEAITDGAAEDESEKITEAASEAETEEISDADVQDDSEKVTDGTAKDDSGMITDGNVDEISEEETAEKFEAEKLIGSIEGTTVTVETDSFSYYVVFTYGSVQKDYKLKLNTGESLKKILDALEISYTSITSAESSDTSKLTVEAAGADDYTVTAVSEFEDSDAVKLTAVLDTGSYVISLSCVDIVYWEIYKKVLIISSESETVIPDEGTRQLSYI